MARRTCALRLAVRSLSLDMIRFLLLSALADGDQAAQQLARLDLVDIDGIGPSERERQPHPRRDLGGATDDDELARPQMTKDLGEAHFFFPSLRKMYSP